MSLISTSNDVILKLRDKYTIQDAVETGTNMGDGAAWLADHFKFVTTMDILPNSITQAKERYPQYHNITYLIGDSRNILPIIIGKLTKTTFFWLDAHEVHKSYSDRLDDWPLMEELDMIFKSPYKHVILIDDINIMMPEEDRIHVPTKPLDETVVPQLSLIVDKAHQNGYSFHSNIYIDVGLILPPDGMDIFEE